MMVKSRPTDLVPVTMDKTSILWILEADHTLLRQVIIGNAAAKQRESHESRQSSGRGAGKAGIHEGASPLEEFYFH